MGRAKGSKLSAIHKQNIARAHIGKLHSKGTKDKMRDSHLGMKYQLMSDGGKDNISSAMKGKISPWKGILNRYSKETLAKMSKAHIQYIADHPGPFSDTSIERKVKRQLYNGGIDFIPQHNVNNRFVCDFYLPIVNLIIETDGDYWHNLERVKKRDKAKDAYLGKCGYNLIRIPEHVINMDSFNVFELIGFDQGEINIKSDE